MRPWIRFLLIFLLGVVFIPTAMLAFEAAGSLVRTIAIQPRALLFNALSVRDYVDVTRKLDAMGYHYIGEDASSIYVSERDKPKILTSLAEYTFALANSEAPPLSAAEKMKAAMKSRREDQAREALEQKLAVKLESHSVVRSANVQVISRASAGTLEITALVMLKSNAPGIHRHERKALAALLHEAVPGAGRVRLMFGWDYREKSEQTN